MPSIIISFLINLYICLWNTLFALSLDMIATMGEVTGGLALLHMRRKMIADKVGSEILQYVKRYTINLPT